MDSSGGMGPSLPNRACELINRMHVNEYNYLQHQATLGIIRVILSRLHRT